MDNINKTQPSTKAKNMLINWRERMGYSPEDACTSLGCTYAQLIRWESGNLVPTYIGLACAALALGMKPYEEDIKYTE
jgi:transcriptional regulator with XRE-family HTH domain